jgi:hypothetical protein
MPNIEVSETAMAYLKKLAEPLVDTTVTVLDRVLAEHSILLVSPDLKASALEMRFAGNDLPSVKFTTILSAKVAQKPTSHNSWNHILEDLISACVKQGASVAEVKSLLQANTLEGQHSENGYRFVPSAGFSFQGLEANRVCRNLAKLSEYYGVALDIEIRWQNDEKAAFPQQTARIVLP